MKRLKKNKFQVSSNTNTFNHSNSILEKNKKQSITDYYPIIVKELHKIHSNNCPIKIQSLMKVNDVHSHISTIRKFNNIITHNIRGMPNELDFDLHFYNYLYNSDNITKDSVQHLNYFKECKSTTHITHFKNINNLYPNTILISYDKSKYYIFYYENNNNILIELKEFVRDYIPLNNIYSIFPRIITNVTKSIITNNLHPDVMKNDFINTMDTMIIIFIGNTSIGIKLLEQVHNYIIKNKCYVSICISNHIFIDTQLLFYINQLIQSIGIDCVFIYTCAEMGNDITPSLLMCNELKKNCKQYNNCKYIIKIHTKSMATWSMLLTNFIFSKSLEQLKTLLNAEKKSACIGSNNYKMAVESSFKNNTLFTKNNTLFTKNNNYTFYCWNYVLY